MSKAKPKVKPVALADGAVLREEMTARRAEARLRAAEARYKAAGIREANKARKEMLATYAAADRGRRNRDWRATGLSADMAIIPDAATLNARARQMVRDSWVVKSAVSAYRRNVVGCGVIPIPQAKDAGGKLLTDLNRAAMLLFWEWAGDKRWCDAEEDQTFWQMQALAESERPTVGEAFWVLTYEPQRLPSGRIDKTRPVGLKIQAFEPEQLDETIQSYSGPETLGVTNEVRGGLELDGRGRTIAYHVYTRNPHDFAWRAALRSVRIPADRVLHYFRKERVRQKRGVTDLTAVLQDARDLTRHKDANLWRAIMEACIGLVVKRDANVSTAGLIGGMQPRASGDSGTTSSGMPTADFVPGMIADPGQGITFEPYLPQAPGNNYAPFQTQTLRGIAAGANLSYGQVSRDFTQGTYSGQRQEMLEDRKEFEPLQELHAHNLLFPVYRLFFALCVMEGRLDVPDFEAAPSRYTAAEYVAPPPTWIDPKAEADAIEKLIELKLMTREEVAHLRGARLIDILDKIQSEAKEAEARDIEFPENKEADGGTVAFKRATIAAFIADGTVADVIANQTDLKALVGEVGLPVNKDYIDPLLPVQDAQGRMVSGDVITDSEGDAVGATVIEPKPAAPADPAAADGQPAPPKDATGAQATAIGKMADALAAVTAGGGGGKRIHLAQAPAADGAPNYRLAAAAVGADVAAAGGATDCAACRYFMDGRCGAYDFLAAADHVCDAFEPSPAMGEGEGEGEGGGGRRVIATPPIPEGERSIDDPRGGYLDRGERGVE